MDDGVWAIYYYEVGPIAKSIHKELVEVVRHQQSGDHVTFWPYGMPLSDAIHLWNEEKSHG